MTRKTNVHYDSYEFLHNDTTNNQAETQCVLKFHLNKFDIKGLKLAFESEYLKKKLFKLINRYGAICDDETNIFFNVSKSCICLSTDKYNQKLGEYIVLTKCQAAAFKISRNFIIELSNIIDDDIMEEMFDISDNMEISYRNHIVHYNELSGKDKFEGLEDDFNADYVEYEDSIEDYFDNEVRWNNFLKNL
jgi:hypothetical protein